jgi:hypothetical protein
MACGRTRPSFIKQITLRTKKIKTNSAISIGLMFKSPKIQPTSNRKLQKISVGTWWGETPAIGLQSAEEPNGG